MSSVRGEALGVRRKTENPIARSSCPLTPHPSPLTFLLCVTLLLNGCALWRPSHDPQAERAWDARRAQLAQVDRFTLQGRFAAGGIFGVKGQLHWQQNPQDFRLRLSGPFGARAVQITGDENGVAIRSAEESFHTSEPETYLRERLGWAVPMQQLRWWVLGMPAPGTPETVELDSAGRLLKLEQDGWTVEYAEYQTAGVPELPRKLELANGELSVKLVVDAWSDLSTTQ